MTQDSTFRSCPRRQSIVGTGTVFLLLVLLLLVGCASQVKSDKTVQLDHPQVENGVIVEADEAMSLEEMAEALDAIDLPTPARNATAGSDESAAETAGQGSTAPARVSVADAVGMAASKALPPEATGLITLPKLSRTEINEASEHLAMHLESELGYSTASAAVADALPVPPTGIIGSRTVARVAENGTHVLRFGYRHFVSQPPQFWVQGVIVGADGALTANPDLAQVEPKVTEIIASLSEMRAGLTVRDLEAKLIQLSYVDAAAALSMLQGMGITTMNKPTEVPPKIEFPRLPYVVNIEDPKKEYTGLVGAGMKTTGSKLSLTPGVASEMADNTIASPTNQLLVLFHPAHPEQFSEVRRILDTLVDRPARQIFIDAMVLEISEQGLRDLGVEWELLENAFPVGLTAGSLFAGASTETLNLNIPDTSLLNEVFEGQFKWDWDITIRALIRTGKAEILSRPSVMTLNNRQSTIRVGRDIPIASSLEGMSNYSNKVSFKFEYLPTGILLNIRPRINEAGTEVSMLIDTVVSAKVPGADLEMKAADGELVLASAPTVSTRRVQTYGRIANNTPLIIGGLVSREQTVTKDKIPFLGDLPLIGMVFRSEKRDNVKREVIIVLTPHVLPNQEALRRSHPKGGDLFDSFGNELFRDSYRIRGVDVFDLTFLLENRRIASYRAKARQVAQKNFRLGENEPFRSFVRDSVPGESIFVTRMIYEVIKRLDTAALIEQSRIIYFDSQQMGGYNVKFLEVLLKKVGGDEMKGLEGKALAITYRYDRDSLEEDRLGTEPIPEIKVVDCPDRDAWGTQLWELNQPTPDGQPRHTILIQNGSDVLRLRRALALKRIALLNGGTEQMRLRNFSVGKVLLMPQLKKDLIHVMDADTARFFFHTEHYYGAALAEIEKQLKQLDKRLRQPEISILLDSSVSGEDSAGGGQ
jgi:Bacterial type II and III secretion system protein